MATRKGDVDLVIRARNDASKALDAVDKAIDTLVGSQKDLSAESGKTSSALADFAKIAATVGSAYNRITTDADKAAASLTRQEASLTENKQAYASLAGQIEAAARVQQKMAGFVGPRTKEQAAQVELVGKAYNDLTTRASKLAAVIDRQDADFRQSFYALQDVAGGAEKAAAALERVKAAQEGAAAAAERQASADSTAAAASTRRAALELRRSMSQTLAGAQTSWKDAQEGIAQLRQQMVAIGPPTREQAEAMGQLLARAQGGKAAYTELREAIARFNSVLRTEGATQEQVAAAQARATAALERSRSAMAQVATTVQRTSNAIRKMGQAESEAAVKGEKLDRSLRSLFANSRRSLSIFQRIRGQVLALASSYLGLIGAINGFNEVLQASLTMQATQVRLEVVANGNTQQAGQEMDWVIGQAKRLGIGLNTMAEEWSKFAIAAQASGMSMQDARKIFLSVAESGRVLHLSTQRLQMVFLALTQMMSKGTIQMEELRRQLGEHLPSAFADMAKAVGVSTAELAKMMKQGQVTSDYLVKFADVLHDRYGGQLQNALHKTQAEMGRFETAMTLALNKIADSGAIDEFTEALRELQAMLESPEADVWFQRLGHAIGGVIKLLMEVLKNMDLIITALAALGAAKGAVYVLNLGKAFVTLIRQMRTAKTVAAGLGFAMDSAFGPIGVVIGILTAGFTYLATRISDTDKAIAASKNTVQEITTAYREGAKSADAWAKSLAKMSSLQINQQMMALKSALDDAMSDLAPSTFDLLTNQLATVNPLGGQIVSGDGMRQLIQVSQAARDGSISLEEFKQKLDAIGQAHPELKDLAIKLQQAADKAIDSKQQFDRFQAAIRLMRGEATNADKALLGLKGSLDDTGNAAAQAAKGFEKYHNALDGIRKLVPSLKKEMKLQDNIAGVKKMLQTGIDNVNKLQVQGAITADKADQMRQGLQDVANKAITILYDSMQDGILKALPLNSKSIEERIIQIESGGKPTAKASTSSAKGIAQFTEGTWLRLFDRVFPQLSDFSKEAKLALRENATASRKMLDVLTKMNQSQLVQAGIDPNAANTYLAHFLGAGDAIKVILANPKELAKNLVQPASVAANPKVFKPGMTAGDLQQWATRKMGGGAPLQASGWTKAESDAAKLADKHAKTVVKINKELDAQIGLIGKTKLAAAIYNETTAKGIDLQSKEGQAIAAKVTKIYNATKATKDAEKEVNDLMDIRKSLEEQLLYNQNQGNTSAVTSLRDQIEQVNTQLKTAIDNAIAMWQAVGGPDSAKAIANLQAQNVAIQEGAKRTLDAKAINEAFTDGAVKGFGSIADAIGGWIDGTLDGKEAIEAIGNAFRQFAADFLRQIAEMILKQIIFNAVSGLMGGGASAGTGGGGLGGIIVGALGGVANHDGGVAGRDGTPRLMLASWLDNAVRYHGGGIAGLAPNEVPTVLEEGEEILTTADPRHVANGGGKPAPVNLKVVNTFDAESVLSEALSGRDGTQSVLNFVKANSGAMRSALGVS